MSARGASRRSALALALGAAALLLAAPAPAAAKTLVAYDKSGGFAGVSLSVTVSTGGSVVVDDDRAGKRRYSLSAARLRGLRRVLADAKVSTLKRSYEPKISGADFFSYRVRYAGRSISVQEGGHPPARLLEVISRMDALASG